VDVEPLHEGLHARLVLALAGDGQQAAALRVFDDLRRRLRDDLGINPGAELRDAQLRVLRGDIGPAVAPGRSGRPKPAQLPADVSGFVGREADLSRLDAMLDRPPAEHGPLVITSIDGMPGVGKTALAVHWAHRVADRFPDGQLYINLRGYDRSTPVQPQQALARFLSALGLSAEQIPADEDEAASLYRTQLAGRRVLVVLDNASSVDQVRSLLPGTSTCLVVVTSRDRLAGLAAMHGIQRLSLDVLEPDDAQALVAGMIGARRAEEEARAVKELTRSCGYVPLVLRVAGANLSVRPPGSASDYVAEIRERRIADGDTVRAAFDLSFERLDPTAQRVFRLLGLTPAEIVPDAVAALADCATSEARAVLHQLSAVSLLQEYSAGRFRLHDLLRGYAAARADDLDAETRTAAAGRILDFYLCSVDAATRVLYPNALRMPLPDAAEPARGMSFTSEDAARAWLDAERPNVLEVITRAAQLGVPEYSWRLVDALRGYVTVGGYSDGIAAFESARSIARLYGDQNAEASVLDVCGLLHFNVSAFQQAVAEHSDALAISRRSGNPDVEARSLHSLGRAYAQIGTMADAASCLEQAITIQHRLGNVVAEASVLAHLSTVALSQADPLNAAKLGSRVLEIARTTGDRVIEVRGLLVAARASWAMGQLDIATITFSECLDVAQASGHRLGQLAARVGLAENLCDLGDYREAEELIVGALTFGRSLGERRQESGCLELLAVVRHHAGSTREAEVLFDEALRQARQVQFRFGEMSVLIGVSDLYRDTGRADEAMSGCQAALDIMRNSGYVLLEARALTGLALACADVGHIDRGVDHARHAVDLAHERGQLLAEARALRALGLVRRMQGDADAARRCCEQARSMFLDIGTPEAGELRNLLADAAAW
jgi:tetratricopeptide (TPR) repeat protein